MFNSDYRQYDLYEFYAKRISHLMACGRREEAQQCAFEWLAEYKSKLAISFPWNWKLAKKQIAAYYFGKRPSLQITSKKDITKLYDFMQQHQGKVVRCTYHKYDSACHSESRRINPGDLEWPESVIISMSHRDIVDVFIENPTSVYACFRRFSLQYNQEVAYEVGYGQAMYVFEAERGSHDVASMHIINGLEDLKEAKDVKLTGHLLDLIKEHEKYFAIKTKTLCYYLGISQISLEGYFNMDNPMQKPFIVDIDLPFDRAFF